MTGLACIFLPPASDSKLNMAVTVVLTYIFLQALVAELTPKAPASPLIGMFILSSLLLAAFYVVACGLIWKLSSLKSHPPRCFESLAAYYSTNRICWWLRCLNSSQKLHKENNCQQEVHCNLTKPSLSVAIESSSPNGPETIDTERACGYQTVNSQANNHNLSPQVTWHVVSLLLNNISSGIYFLGNVIIYIIFLSPIMNQVLTNHRMVNQDYYDIEPSFRKEFEEFK